jgi:hypothetical protein
MSMGSEDMAEEIMPYSHLDEARISPRMLRVILLNKLSIISATTPKYIRHSS